ncbi:MAG: DapH/DapD/GlmU-related protein [Erysipelotrichaceae bacterium]|nr:DapH/DapD/GlmU-related protein [Erysipelotrichaceae bacterium]
MDVEFERVDLRKADPKDREFWARQGQLAYIYNHTMPGTPEYDKAMRDIYGDNFGENSFIAAPISGVCFDRIKMGKNSHINGGSLCMARGGITIGDNVQVASNAQLITNNHDEYERMVLTCKPILIDDGAWLGAGVTVLPGVRIGKHAIVGAASVVTKDVPDYAVAVGNPAKVIRMLDPKKFEE